ncbi:hypothetical protein [Lysinibacillus sp. SGAir0095]|uniref:hypothetical protein n=1 Tax=Lysinibacillus sp. SGAir0095 TaxID=2070463 RepID=UPI0010CD3A10|nr:hypothetical protein [Lysinibacillus sp. SGAir0095]QCR32378.1 hypothetical protein C1N55_09405 [Lysinibacillus sp. SGAir0095]
MLTGVRQKCAITLEGYPIQTEISDVVYEDLVASNSKYILLDKERNIITLKRSFFKRNKQVQNVTRFFVELNGDDITIDTLSEKNSLVLNSGFADDLIDTNYKNKTIAILLESPHIDEYEQTREKLVPIGAAQGQTGKKIEKSIESLILALKEHLVLEEQHKYRVIIINAVNFQTSLHFIHEKPMNNYYRELRDKMWLKMWTEIPQIKNDLIRQLDSLKKDSIIINACPKSLKPFINQEHLQFANRFSLFESNHPSSTEIWTKSLFKLN